MFKGMTMVVPFFKLAK
jgi:alpha-beta hydrolase superfamily lysophospholipase